MKNVCKLYTFLIIQTIIKNNNYKYLKRLIDYGFNKITKFTNHLHLHFTLTPKKKLSVNFSQLNQIFKYLRFF